MSFRVNLLSMKIKLALAKSPVTPFYSIWKGRTPLHFINLNLLALCPTLTVRLYVVKVQIAWQCGIFSHSVRIYEVFSGKFLKYKSHIWISGVYSNIDHKEELYIVGSGRCDVVERTFWLPLATSTIDSQSLEPLL